LFLYFPRSKTLKIKLFASQSPEPLALRSLPGAGIGSVNAKRHGKHFNHWPVAAQVGWLLVHAVLLIFGMLAVLAFVSVGHGSVLST
jgi:hypothetical protein